MSKKKFVKCVVAVLSTLMFSGVIVPSVMSNLTYATHNSSSEKRNVLPLTFTDESRRRIDLMIKINDELTVDSLGFLKLKNSKVNLYSKYGLSKYEIELINQILNDYNLGISQSLDRAYIDDWHLILDKNDLLYVLGVVNAVGPMALPTALAAASSVVPGVGTIIGAVLGFWGASKIIGNATYAVLTNKKLKLGLTGVSVIN